MLWGVVPRASGQEGRAMSNIMERWMRESLNALEVMEAQRAEHEAAMEAAMDAIRRHSTAIERLEKDIAIVREALETMAHEPEEAVHAPAVPGVAPQGPLVAPPIRPVGPRLVAQ